MLIVTAWRDSSISSILSKTGARRRFGPNRARKPRANLDRVFGSDTITGMPCCSHHGSRSYSMRRSPML
jgi:hypothetical protein